MKNEQTKRTIGRTKEGEDRLRHTNGKNMIVNTSMGTSKHDNKH